MDPDRTSPANHGVASGRRWVSGSRGRSGSKRAGALIAVAALLPAACGSRAPVTQEALVDALAAGRPPHILDVRTTSEYAKGHVPGAAHIPYHEVWLRRSELPTDTSDPIVVYCSHGPRAGIAAFQLWALGYGNVSFLQGQMTAWLEVGLPLRFGSQP